MVYGWPIAGTLTLIVVFLWLRSALRNRLLVVSTFGAQSSQATTGGPLLHGSLAGQVIKGWDQGIKTMKKSLDKIEMLRGKGLFTVSKDR